MGRPLERDTERKTEKDACVKMLKKGRFYLKSSGPEQESEKRPIARDIDTCEADEEIGAFFSLLSGFFFFCRNVQAFYNLFAFSSLRTCFTYCLFLSINSSYS